MNVFIKGLNGCWMRKTDIKRYQEFFVSNGHVLVDTPERADITLLWTCAFRRDFRDNSLAQIERYQKEFKAELIVCGCLPDIAPEQLRRYFNGRIISWRNDETQMKQIFKEFSIALNEVDRILAEGKLCDNAAEYRKLHPDQAVSFSDQFVKVLISEGCRFNCTYCSEKLAFPPYRSFSEQEIVTACEEKIAAHGQMDILLLGDSIGDYGHDIGSNLPELMRKIKAIDNKVTISFHGLNPAHFVQYFGEMQRFLEQGDIKHISIPIQSASDRILHLMGRSYTRSDVDRIFTLFNKIGFKGFETHLIIGFPGETEKDFKETMDLILQYRPNYILASGFMEAEGAPASKLPGKVDEDLQTRRLHDAARIIRAAGILCNTDNSTLSINRFNALNRVGVSGEKQI